MTTVFLCCANGEGSHEFRVAEDEAGVMAFYKEMFGPDSEGKMDSAIEHFRDGDNWCNDGSNYQCELYCATFEVWKVEPRELMFTRPEALRTVYQAPSSFKLLPKDPTDAMLNAIDAYFAKWQGIVGGSDTARKADCWSALQVYHRMYEAAEISETLTPSPHTSVSKGKS